MRRPPATSSTETLLNRFGEYHLATLKAQDKSRSVADEFEAVQTELRDIYEARLLSERRLTQAEAISEVTEAELKQKMRKVEMYLLASVNKKRTRDPYASAFPNGLVVSTKRKGTDLLTEAERLLQVLSILDGVPEAVKTLIPSTEESVGTLHTRLEAVEEAEKEANTASANEESSKRVWREQYRKDHGMLIALFPDEDQVVESFFRSSTRRSKKKPPSQ